MVFGTRVRKDRVLGPSAPYDHINATPVLCQAPKPLERSPTSPFNGTSVLKYWECGYGKGRRELPTNLGCTVAPGQVQPYSRCLLILTHSLKHSSIVLCICIYIYIYHYVNIYIYVCIYTYMFILRRGRYGPILQHYHLPQLYLTLALLITLVLSSASLLMVSS